MKGKYSMNMVLTASKRQKGQQSSLTQLRQNGAFQVWFTAFKWNQRQLC